MPQKRNTRDEILSVAMRLFTEGGYDATSLRQIAEEIGVTKAALYYHFRTKGEIVRAAFEAHEARVAALLGWLETTQSDADRNPEVVERLEALHLGGAAVALQFAQANPTVVEREGFGESHLGQMGAIIEAIAPEPLGAEARMRALLAFGAVAIGAAAGGVAESALVTGTPKERQQAARRVALELLESVHAERVASA